MTKNGGYLAGQKAKPPLTAGVADVSIPRPRRGAGRQRARAVRETGTQKPPLTAWLVRAILRLCTLQMPCPRRDTGGPGVRVIRATGTQKPPPTAKPVRAVWGLSALQAPVPEGTPTGGPGVRVIRATGTQKPPPTAKPVRAVGGWGLSALQTPVPEETSAGGQNVSRFAGQNAKTAAGRAARQGDLGSVHASKAPSPEWRRGLCAVVPQPMQAYTSKLSCTSAAVRGISKAVEPPAGIASHQALSPERSAPSPSR